MTSVSDKYQEWYFVKNEWVVAFKKDMEMSCKASIFFPHVMGRVKPIIYGLKTLELLSNTDSFFLLDCVTDCLCVLLTKHSVDFQRKWYMVQIWR